MVLLLLVALTSSSPAFLQGRVRLPNGVPAAGAIVGTGLCERGTTIAGADGRFTLAVTPNTYQVRAWLGAKTGVSKSVEARISGMIVSDLTIELSDAAVIAGGIRDDVSHAPIVGARVSFLREGHAGDCGTTTSDASGTFVSPPLVPGTYSVRVEATDHARLLREHLRVGPGGRGELELELRRPATITGIVVDDHGTPLANVPVTARLSDERLQSITGADGRFVFAGVPPERTLVVAKRADETGCAVAEAFAHDDHALRLTLPPSGRVVVRAPSDYAVELIPVDDALCTVGIGGDDTVFGATVPAGRYRAYLVDANRRRRSDVMHVEITPGAEAQITLLTRPRLPITSR